MPRDASELAHRLAREAEAVCRHYLSNGRREGRYWLVGDVHNTPGRSMFVRLQESPKGPAGKWTDAATGEHGDLLDVIRESRGLRDFREVAEEARRFLRLPRTDPEPVSKSGCPTASRPDRKRRQDGCLRSQVRLRGLWSRRICSVAELLHVHHGGSLRFHPRCYYRPDEHLPTETWPAMIACVTDLDGRITGVHRTWLDPDGLRSRSTRQGPIDTPRRAMGDLLGNAVRFGVADDVLAAGEGIETMLSLRCVLSDLADGRSAFRRSPRRHPVPLSLRRLYIARDADAAGDAVVAVLTQRAKAAGIEAITLSPRLGDFNEDLHIFGLDALRAALRIQLAPEDVARFLPSSTAVA